MRQAWPRRALHKASALVSHSAQVGKVERLANLSSRHAPAICPFVCKSRRISLIECPPVSNKLPFEMALGTRRFGAWVAVAVVTLLGALVLSRLVVVTMGLLW